ncbi:translesion error-prone DNA polymerase V autoproteolytic subunit [Gramella sp. GC03-9]|uniref:Translesion error-prone DNA polymerase V autoproteolytic subunit n=1 Tax=Christiangramia oceanisediminis TaxID=2920386 RepID=A0A9X2KW78_9FLAO|nr:translesion error-prone DNA polymerase V autoproteolytic subunit [Gramella oceanisediminis]MCP9199019.1 translesion error-prone DNA polymerase V autoproteolytic subunit [Gramella oceanisediminis]
MGVILNLVIPGRLQLPFVGAITAGFPSPADDHLDKSIDLNSEIIKDRDATFFGRVEGDSMTGAGIEHGDLLVINKGLEPRNGKIAVCFIDGEFTVKRIKIEKDVIWLIAENQKYQPIKVTAENDFLIWGIVTNVIKYV